jgi:hypothetical protein
LHAGLGLNEELIADRLAQPPQSVTYRRGSYRKFSARFPNIAVLHHSIKHPEQIQVDHANLNKLPLYIVSTVLDFAFPKSFSRVARVQLVPRTNARELWGDYTNIGQNCTAFGIVVQPKARCSCGHRLVLKTSGLSS